MAHEITTRKNGFIEFAAVGSRKEVWHGLGQYVTQEELNDIETAKKVTGMDWEIFTSPVMYQAFDAQKMGMSTKIDSTRNVLFRSDNHEVLSVMSADYKIVQPGEVLEFFRDLVSQHGLNLSAAGTLFGGKKYWATAELGKAAQVVDGDHIGGYLLLTTSADGTMATTAKVTSVRTVCNNTLQFALAGNGRVLKCSHNKTFDPKQFKIDLGLIDEGWDSFIGNLRTLADQKVTDGDAQAFFRKLIGITGAEVTMGEQRQLDALNYFYDNGSGAEFAKGTKWNLLNAVTEMHTHQTARIDSNHRFNNSEFGKNAAEKVKAYEMLIG